MLTTGRSHTSMIARSIALAGAALAVLAGCGDGGGSSSQTTLALNATNYVTQPPTPTSTTTTTLPGQTPPDGAPPQTVPGEQTYTVQQGDYPLGVAKLFGITLDQLAGHNGWADPLNLTYAQFYPGLVIKIPPGAAVPTTTIAPPASAQTTTTGATTTTVDTEGQGTYTIKEGDIPSRIAANFDVTLEQLAAANGWASTQPTNAEFQVGKKLIIPAKTG